jgi:hypothetical protein
VAALAGQGLAGHGVVVPAAQSVTVLAVQDAVAPAAQSVAMQAPDGLAAPNAEGLAAHDAIVMARTLLLLLQRQSTMFLLLMCKGNDLNHLYYVTCTAL